MTLRNVFISVGFLVLLGSILMLPVAAGWVLIAATLSTAAVGVVYSMAGRKSTRLESPGAKQPSAATEAPSSRADLAAGESGAENTSQALEEEKFGTIVRRNQELLVLYSLTNVVSSSLSLAEVLETGLSGVIKLFGAGAGEISVIGIPEETLVVYVKAGQIASTFRGPEAPRLAKKLAKQVCQTGTPKISIIGQETGERRIRHSGLSSLAVFPLRNKQRVLGTISLACPESTPISNVNPEFLLSIGSILGAAIENSRLYQRMKKISDTDPVTGLYNHRFIIKRLNAELRRAQRYEHPVAVMMLDVDDFKRLNDLYGHQFGDSALRKIAIATVAACRDTDFVGRYGGDELLLVLPETAAQAAQVVARRIRNHIEHLRIRAERDAEPVRTTASLGLAVYPEAGKSGAQMIKAADINLYRSKKDGKDRLKGQFA